MYSRSLNHEKMVLMCNILLTTSVTMIGGRCDGKSLLQKDTGRRDHIH